MNDKVRLYWLDWMKTIGMFFIVWGHLFPNHLKDFIYAFNVPLFFFVSGYLSHIGGGNEQLKKLFKTLFVPYIIVCTSYLFINSVFLYTAGDLTILNLIRSEWYMLLGYQSVSHGIGSVNMWFVYTLLLIKILYVYIRDMRIHGVIVLLSLCGAYALKDCHACWSVQNVLVSLPFFYVGMLSKNQIGDWINSSCDRLHNLRDESMAFKLLVCTFSVVATVILYLLSSCNGFVQMYDGGFGNNIFLFVLNAIVGISLMLVLCSLLIGYKPSWLLTISTGSILILAYQNIAIKAYGGIFLIGTIKEYKNNDLFTVIAAMIIMIAFVPLIRLAQKHVPIVMGGRK